MGVAGLVAHPWMVSPAGNTPAVPDGTTFLTNNLLNLNIDINYLLLWKRVGLTSFPSFPSYCLKNKKQKKTYC